MTQPGVSRAIGALEAEVGAPLLRRGRDGVEPTDAGGRALAHVRAALRHHDMLHAEVAEVAGRVTGTLRLASFPSATARLIPPRLRTFTERYPHVKVRFFEGTDQEVRDWLSGDAAEVGVVTLPSTELETFPLASDEMIAVLPDDHDLARQERVSLKALETEPFILSTGGCEPLITAAARHVGARLQITYEAREVSTVLAMVAARLGVSIVPTLALPVETDGVSARPLHPRTPRMLGLAVRSLAEASPAARAFIESATQPR